MARIRRRSRLATGALSLAVVFAGGGVTVGGMIAANAATEPVESRAAEPAAAPGPVGTARPTVETPAEFDDDEGGNADADAPAIWINPDKAQASLVIGTLKDAGLSVFDLAGKQVQRIAAPPAPGPDDVAGRLNNVDILYGVRTGKGRQDIAVVSDRGRDQLRIFRIDAKAATAGKPALTDITDPAAPFVFSADQAEVNTQNTAYGVAAFLDDDEPLVLVTREHTTRLGLVRLVAKGGRMGYEVVRTADLPARFTLPDGSTFTPCEDPGEAPQSEGMVVDVEEGVVYVGQEDVGLWKMAATLQPFRPELVDKAREFGVPATFDPVEEECVVSGPDPGFGGEHLSADVEGLTIYHRGDDDGYLIASSQGDSTFAVYELGDDNAFIGSFQVGDSASGIDGVQETDSLTVTNVPLGKFRHGLAVFADGANTPEVAGPDGEARDNTNFKLVPWESVANSFDPPLEIDTDGFDPRD
ncbi:MAG TPA: phytase [Actinoplanes sp.]|jgi:3-phytase